MRRARRWLEGQMELGGHRWNWVYPEDDGCRRGQRQLRAGHQRGAELSERYWEREPRQVSEGRTSVVSIPRERRAAAFRHPVGGHRRRDPFRPGPHPRGPDARVGGIRAASRPAGRRAPGPRPRPGQRRRLLPLQLPRVLRGVPRRPEDPRGACQRELPLRRRRVAGAAGELRGRGAFLRLGAARAGGVDPPRGPRGSPARRGRRGCLRRSPAGSLRLSGADRLVRAWRRG